jgi:hypothetical protein
VALSRAKEQQIEHLQQERQMNGPPPKEEENAIKPLPQTKFLHPNLNFVETFEEVKLSRRRSNRSSSLRQRRHGGIDLQHSSQTPSSTCASTRTSSSASTINFPQKVPHPTHILLPYRQGLTFHRRHKRR